MCPKPIDTVVARIAAVTGQWGRGTTLEQMRKDFTRLVSNDKHPPLTPVEANAVPAAWIGAESDSVLMYCHGGGYQMGSIASHGTLMADLAVASGARVLGFDYRLAPEHRYPAALEDSLAVYRWLLEQGIAPARLSIGGDSAGAGLALATLLKARDQGLPMPAAAVFLSPWVDMQARSDTYESRAALDPLTQRQAVLMMAKTYLGRDGDPSTPYASPINGDLSGLPPILIHVGDHETVLGDSHLLTEKARAAGTEVDLVIWKEMIHHFQVFPELEETSASMRQIGTFLRDRLR